MIETANRRPLKSRETAWAARLAKSLAAVNVQPDLISASSVAAAVLGGALLAMSASLDPAVRAPVLILAAVCVQLRLLANLLDGMVAVEHGKGSPAGPIWNELPDRVADILFMAGAGYGAFTVGHEGAAALGWICAALAVMTAYVRELGRGLGLPADFSGPMAKPHRMAVLTGACVLSAFEPLWGWHGEVLLIALAGIAIGCMATIWRRVRHMAKALRAKDEASPAG